MNAAFLAPTACKLALDRFLPKTTAGDKDRRSQQRNPSSEPAKSPTLDQNDPTEQPFFGGQKKGQSRFKSRNQTIHLFLLLCLAKEFLQTFDGDFLIARIKRIFGSDERFPKRFLKIPPWSIFNQHLLKKKKTKGINKNIKNCHFYPVVDKVSLPKRSSGERQRTRSVNEHVIKRRNHTFKGGTLCQIAIPTSNQQVAETHRTFFFRRRKVKLGSFDTSCKKIEKPKNFARTGFPRTNSVDHTAQKLCNVFWKIRTIVVPLEHMNKKIQHILFFLTVFVWQQTHNPEFQKRTRHKRESLGLLSRAQARRREEFLLPP
jgi:hypothetical protein